MSAYHNTEETTTTQDALGRHRKTVVVLNVCDIDACSKELASPAEAAVRDDAVLDALLDVLRQIMMEVA